MHRRGRARACPPFPPRRVGRELPAAFGSVEIFPTVWRNFPPAVVYTARRAVTPVEFVARDLRRDPARYHRVGPANYACVLRCGTWVMAA